MSTQRGALQECVDILSAPTNMQIDMAQKSTEYITTRCMKSQGEEYVK